MDTVRFNMEYIIRIAPKSPVDTRSRNATWVLCLAASLLALGGCEQQAPREEVQAELCSNLTELRVALTQLSSAGPYTTVGEIREAQQEAQEEVQQIVENAEDLEPTRVEQLREAMEDLEEAVNNIPDDATVAEAATEIQPRVMAVEQARAELSASIDCAA